MMLTNFLDGCDLIFLCLYFSPVRGVGDNTFSRLIFIYNKKVILHRLKYKQI